MSDRFGSTELPPDQQDALRRARRLERGSLVFIAVAVTLVYLSMGSSQAMKAAWIEDCLSFLPPIAFLIAARRAGRRPDHAHPYGHHRTVGAAHLASAVALLIMGAFLAIDSAMTLVLAEHPTIGTVHIFGQTFWQGWLMIAVLIVTGVPNVILGRMKMKLAEPLHDKVLFADADMNKADWATSGGAVLGIIGIGLGLWWADSAVAIFIAASIVKDGVTNLKAAVGDLLDRQAHTYDDASEHPLLDDVEAHIRALPWVADARVRMRDQGHVFHTEIFVVPRDTVDVRLVDAARASASELDWKLEDLVVIPVTKLPASR